MPPLRTLSRRAEVIVDQWGFFLSDPTGMGVVGVSPIPDPVKIVYALATNLQSGQTRRYLPSHDPGESCLFACDFSSVIPIGIGIRSGTLTIQENVVPPKDASADWTIGEVQVNDRALYARLTGGKTATDYALNWLAVDTSGNQWPRVAFVLCARTS